jgi:copper ion binding protein
MPTKTFSVPNINCGHCSRTIERELGELKGVNYVKADVDSKKVTVEWEDPLTWNDIQELLEDIDYPAVE